MPMDLEVEDRDDMSESEFPEDFKSNVKLHRAAKKGQVRTLKRLCKSALSPDAVNEQHQSPLFVAALHGRVKAVEFLLEAGANPNHTCHDGSTPMHAACLACNPRIICLLADAGGNINYHDSRGLLPKDWVSYQEDIGKRFKMRKFLEAMRLFNAGSDCDQRLIDIVSKRSRWTALADYVRKLPKRNKKRWRRRHWFSESRRFGPGLSRRARNFFDRLRDHDCLSFRRRTRATRQDVSQLDTLPSNSVIMVGMKADNGDVLVNSNYDNEECDVDGCQLQMSDTKYPVQTLFVDEKHGKILSSKDPLKNDRQAILSEIDEERSSQNSSGSSPLPSGEKSCGVERRDGHLCGDCRGVKTKKEAACQIQLTDNVEVGQISAEVYQEDGHVRNGVQNSRVIGNTESYAKTKKDVHTDGGKSSNQNRAQKAVLVVLGENEETQKLADESVSTGQEVGDEESPNQNRAQNLDDGDEESGSTDDSCRNQLLEILDDAFKIELAPGVSKLMDEYCDSTQGSTAATESFDIDFLSYHGDDNEDAESEEINWIGPIDDKMSDPGSVDLKNDDQERLSPGEITPSEALHHAEMEIDRLLMESAGQESGSDASDDEATRNFIKEGRYVDVQRMLSHTLEDVFPEHPTANGDDIKTKQESTAQGTLNTEGEEGNGSVSIDNSSLYRVSALDEAAFISDLSLEVNVTGSHKSSLDGFLMHDAGAQRQTAQEDEGDEEMGCTTLHSTLARMDLTRDEMREVQEWFAGHGSVRTLVREYESKIREYAKDPRVRSNVASLGELLHKEYGNLAARRMAEKNSNTVKDPPTEMASKDEDNLTETDSDSKILEEQQKENQSQSDTTGSTPTSPTIMSTSAPKEGRSYNESWLWPGSGDEDETFEEQLRRSMDAMGMPSDNDDDNEEGDGEKAGPPKGGQGDAEKIAKEGGESPALISPPPPTSTPEEGSSPRPSPENQADDSVSSRVNNSGDCEPVPTTGLCSQPEAAAKEMEAQSAPPASPSRETSTPGGVSDLSPQSDAAKKLAKIDVMRSPTVEAIYISSV